MQPPLRYLALGDSFTLGVGASDAHHNFPTGLSRRLAAATGRLVRLINAALDGSTTDDLIRDELDQVDRVAPDYVTVLIGGNDVWHGRTRSEYQGSLVWIYDTLAARGLAPQRVAAVSIPDWSAAPGAARYGHADQLRLVIDGYNALARSEAASRGFVWVDIAELSRSRVAEADWLAPDQLHPADAQYAAWAERIWDTVREAWTAT